ncbi:MAG: MMPL family transporter [Rhodoferax sp.]
MRYKGALTPLLAWAVALLACVVVMLQTHFVTDLSAFMPKTPNARQQLLIDQLHDGAVARLVLIGIEGGSDTERARLSRALAEAMRKSQRFVSVQNGEEAALARDRAYFFENRYLLSPTVTPARFTVEGLHGAVSETLEAMAGEAGMTIKRLFVRDPTGETLQLLEQFADTNQPQSQNGVWASRDGERALLMALTRAAGSDTEAQSQAVESVRTAFAALPERDLQTRLVMSGTGVSSAASRNTIEREVSRLAGASFILVVALLLVVYRSFVLLGLGILPVLTGVAAGVAAVSLVFGQVHGLTLGFGTTLIGEAVDYAIYFFVQRSTQHDAQRFWRTIWLGMLTSVVGFAALVSSSFPGLAQLGLYSIVGLIAAVLVTRYVLPVLTPQQMRLRDLRSVSVAMDDAIDHAGAWRWPLVGLILVAAASIGLHEGGIWNRSLSGLNPIPKSEQGADQKLRSDLGGVDSRFILALSAPDTEVALQQAERVGVVLQRLVNDQVLGGFSSPAGVLPSLATQERRRAALPDPDMAKHLLEQAVQGLPVSAARLQGFLQDLESARQQASLTRASLDGTAVAMLVDTLLIARPSDMLVLMPLRAVSEGARAGTLDLERVHQALRAAGLDGVTVIDMVEESRQLFDGYRHEVLWLTGIGFLLIVVLLGLALRSWQRALRVAAPLAGAVVCVAAVLLAQGTQLAILHMVGLLLVVAIGSNYALFFDRGAQTGQELDRQQTQVSLLVANLTTVGSFGLLGFSDVPVLAAIGTTVAPGALLALVFAAILTRERSVARVD